MRILIFFCGLSLFLTACSSEQMGGSNQPTDLAGVKKVLREKKASLKALETEIAGLEKTMMELDTTKKVVSRQLVTTKPVDKKAFSRYVEIQSNVKSVESVMASSETGGRLLRMSADEGQYVKKGQLIARVDMESINKQIDEIQKSKELAVQVYERQKRLWDQNIGTEIQYLQAKNSVERMDKSLETLRHQMTKANVYAPISGVVNTVYAEQGETAGPGTPIIEIMNTSRVKVVADVPERYLKSIKRGEMVSVRFPALEREEKARVSMIGNSINPANRTFEVEVNLRNKSGLLKPNLLAIMLINDFSVDEAVVVPIEVVQQDVSGRNYVFIAEDGTEGLFARKVFIETGESAEGEIVVMEGLSGGERLILEGARGLGDRELVKI